MSNEKYIKPSFYGESLLLNLKNGNLFESTKEFSIKNPNQNLKLLNHNDFPM